MSAIGLLLVALMLFAYILASQDECEVAKLDDQSLKECGNTGYAMRCNKTGLKTVPQWYPLPDRNFSPPLCLLDLSENNLKTLPNGSFVYAKNLNTIHVLWMYFKFCNLTFIASNAFENFTSLLYLNLTGNYLNTPGSLEAGVFKPLTSLKNINLRENNFTTLKILGRELQYLKTLVGLYVDLCEGCEFDIEFKNLTNLVNLSLSGRSENACNSPLITNNTFKYVTNLKGLWIASCHIEKIEADAFSHLKHLELLDLSYNENLTFSGMNTALYGLRNLSTLKELNVNRIHTLWETGIALKYEDITYLKTLNALEVLHMDLNKIEVFDETILNPYQLPASLKDFTLSGNRLTYGKYVLHLYNATSIVKLDISRQHLNYDPFFQEHFEPVANVKKQGVTSALQDNIQTEATYLICLPPNINTLIWRKSFLYFQVVKEIVGRGIVVCGAENLRHLDLSFNLINKWIMPIFGLDKVTHLDLSENYCDEASPEFFEEFKSLTHLNLSGNFLGCTLLPEKAGASQMFGKMPNIKLLDLSMNKIKGMSKDIFMNLTNLRYLNLSGNLIEIWNSTFSNTSCLKELDLSQNKLAILPQFLTDQLDTMVTRSCDGQEKLYLRLSGNPWVCSCNSLTFLNWTVQTEVLCHLSKSDTCSLNGERHSLSSKEDVQKIIHILESEVCVDKNNFSWVISVVSSGGTAFLSILICGLVYRSRWKIRYIYYSRNRRYIHEGYDHLFENDAFVSYAKHNASFIKNSMVPSLEQQHDLRLWVADRNSLAGNSIAENITHAIYNSRKAVLLVDAAYLKDSWCDYEMNMALMESVETKRKMLVIVLFETIKMEDLPLSMLKLLQSERSLEYPQHEQDVQTFWMNLAEEIRSCS